MKHFGADNQLQFVSGWNELQEDVTQSAVRYLKCKLEELPPFK
jgi:hypothetical protein